MKKSIALLVALAVPSLVAAQAMDNNAKFEKALSAARDGDAATAVVLFSDLAHRNDSSAQMNLAVLTALGHGTPQDETEALFWAWRARFGGENRAIDLTKYLSRQLPAKQRAAVAKRLLEELEAAAEQGHPASFLGMCRTENEVREPAKPVAALAWCSVAAAFEVQGAAVLRDALGMELSVEDKTKAQLNGRALFLEWCKRVPEETRPISCPDVS